MTSKAAQVIAGGRVVRVTNLDKVMYPATGTTKAEVIAYYQQVADWLLPHVARRPVTRKRWVHGVGPGEDGSFFEKNVPTGTPEWVPTVELVHDDGPKTYPLVEEAATLVWLAQLAALELHVPQWRVDDHLVAQNPDRLVLDLDPGEGASTAQVVELAHLLREVLLGVGIESVPVTSGSKGIHVYARLDGNLDAAGASAFAHQLARSLEQLRPDLVVSDMKKAVRAGKVLLDWSQNNGNKTTVAPYSLRGRAHPCVATPRRWEELDEDLRQLEFAEVLARLDTDGDPLAAPQHAAAAPADRVPEPEVVHAMAPRSPPLQAPALEPMLATPATGDSIQGDDWHCEIKWDGYRALAEVREGRVRLTSRRGQELSDRYPELRELTTLLPGREALLDGEIVVLDDSGVSRFELLQNHATHGRPAHYMAFDLLRLDGQSLLDRGYLDRRALLEELIGEGSALVRVPVELGTDVDAAMQISRDMGLEGIVAKKADSSYSPGRRSAAWLKVKHGRTQECVVVGWTPGTGSRAHTLGAVLLAVHEDDELVYVGKAGSGFNEQSLADAVGILGSIEVDRPAAVGVPREVARVARWADPLLVGEVNFSEWTSTGQLRHPVWRGWRPDMRAEEVRRER